MKIRKNILYIFLLFVSLYTIPTRTTVLVQGDATSPYTFTSTVTAKVYDCATGTLYVGLESGAEEYALSKAIRTSGNMKPQFTGIANDATIKNEAIEFLYLATTNGNKTPNLAIVKKDVDYFTQKKVIVSSNDGTTVQETVNTLNDASGALNADGAETNGIVGLAANNSFVFSAVRSQSHGGLFGSQYSGIALLTINADTLEPVQLAAVTGDAGIKAKQVDATINEVKINNDPTLVPDFVSLHWDDTLERLYIGLQLTTPALDNTGAKSIVVARINNCKLELSNIALNGTFFQNNFTNIVGLWNTGGAQQYSLAVAHIRTMHCSTGPDYLIVNGGNGTIDQVNNQIYALPLVNSPTTPSDHGTLARKDAPLSNYKFTIPATTNAHLPTSTETPVQVGRGPLPIQASTPISDIVVIGDTVYVSINVGQSNQNDSGIFYSQASFDEDGKIKLWTRWTKRAFPCDACLNLPTGQGRTDFFAVDALTAKIWAVDGITRKAVRITAWDQGGSNSSSLPAQLTRSLYDGCYSALDLDQSTRDFLGNTVHRYALFGGVNKIAFARTSEAFAALINGPQTVITDFSSAQNFLTTRLPEEGGCVCCLEYARRLTGEGNQNYFFAGTENGLFVFADSNGNGFNVNQLTYLNVAPFNGTWHKIPTINDSVIAVKTRGYALYLLTRETTTHNIQSTLYRIPFTTNIATMFAPGNIYTIGETQTGIFSMTHLFFGIEIISTSDFANKEQLVLATNDGLFRSEANQTGANTGISGATNQTDANWNRIVQTDTTLYTGITGIDNTQFPTTVWPISVQDENDLLTCERSSIHQVSGTSIVNPFRFIPQNFNAYGTTDPFVTLSPIRSFWTDGARRFFIINRLIDKSTENKIMIFPWDTYLWNVTQPEQHIVINPIVSSIPRFYWANQIGVTGILLVGTNNGVIALE